MRPTQSPPQLPDGSHSLLTCYSDRRLRDMNYMIRVVTNSAMARLEIIHGIETTSGFVSVSLNSADAGCYFTVFKLDAFRV